MTTPYDRLKALGLALPTPAVPVANYVPYVLANGFLYLSGQGPRRADGSMPAGKVGADVSVEQAYLDAQLTGLNLLAVAHMALGDLARVRGGGHGLAAGADDGRDRSHPAGRRLSTRVAPRPGHPGEPG